MKIVQSLLLLIIAVSTNSKSEPELSDDEVNKLIQSTIPQLNANFPVKIDAFMTATRAYAGMNRDLVYEYELKIKASKREEAIKTLNPLLRKRETNNYCSNPDLKWYRKHNVVMEHYFTDSQRNFLFKVRIDKSACKIS